MVDTLQSWDPDPNPYKSYVELEEEHKKLMAPYHRLHYVLIALFLAGWYVFIKLVS